MKQSGEQAKNNPTEIAARIRVDQDRLAANLGGQFDFIVCGAGTSGSVVAGRLAANPAVKVLLPEAGGTDELEFSHESQFLGENSRQRLGLGIHRRTKPAPEWARHPLLNG